MLLYHEQFLDGAIRMSTYMYKQRSANEILNRFSYKMH